MANKLAGQKMKFTKARMSYYGTDNESEKNVASRQMAEVLAWAKISGITEAEVTQGYEFPEGARRLSEQPGNSVDISEADVEHFVEVVQEAVDRSGAKEIGTGPQCVYAYGYRCAPGRLKVGRCDGDVVTRITSQINTSTPDQPILELLIRTDDCRSLEKALHGVLQVRGRKRSGGGDEWFETDRAELICIYEFCVEAASSASQVARLLVPKAAN